MYLVQCNSGLWITIYEYDIADFVKANFLQLCHTNGCKSQYLHPHKLATVEVRRLSIKEIRGQ